MLSETQFLNNIKDGMLNSLFLGNFVNKQAWLFLLRTKRQTSSASVSTKVECREVGTMITGK